MNINFFLFNLAFFNPSVIHGPIFQRLEKLAQQMQNIFILAKILYIFYFSLDFYDGCFVGLVGGVSFDFLVVELYFFEIEAD